MSRAFNMTSRSVSMLTLASRLIASSGLLYRSDRRAQLHRSLSSSGCSWQSCSGLWNLAKTSLGPPVLTPTSETVGEYTWAVLSQSLVSPQDCGREPAAGRWRPVQPDQVGWMRAEASSKDVVDLNYWLWSYHSLWWNLHASIHNLFYLPAVLFNGKHLVQRLFNVYNHIYLLRTQHITVPVTQSRTWLFIYAYI